MQVVWGLGITKKWGFCLVGFAPETKPSFSSLSRSISMAFFILSLFGQEAAFFSWFLLFLLYFIVSYVARVLLEGSSFSFLSVY